jgi:hypothetical protein
MPKKSKNFIFFLFVAYLLIHINIINNGKYAPTTFDTLATWATVATPTLATRHWLPKKPTLANSHFLPIQNGLNSQANRLNYQISVACIPLENNKVYKSRSRRFALQKFTVLTTSRDLSRFPGYLVPFGNRDKCRDLKTFFRCLKTTSVPKCST